MNSFKMSKTFYGKIPRHLFVRGYSELYKKIIPKGSLVLDYGCGDGSIGGLGQVDGRLVEGLDRDHNNTLAIYHDMSEVEKFYDYIIFSQILEHCEFNEMAKIIEWSSKKARHIIIGIPNMGNPFTSAFFYNDITHVKPYDNEGFIHFLNCNGLRVSAIYRSNLDINLSTIMAFIRSLAKIGLISVIGLSPFICTIILCDIQDPGPGG